MDHVYHFDVDAEVTKRCNANYFNSIHDLFHNYNMWLTGNHMHVKIHPSYEESFARMMSGWISVAHN